MAATICLWREGKVNLNDYHSLADLYKGCHDQRWILGELRSNHAGETGAVWIYRGVLSVFSASSMLPSKRDAKLREFCERHLATEQQHLAIMEQLLPPTSRSRLLPLWRFSAYFLGLLPALIGPRSVYVVISAVETFVETHYQQQIDRLHGEGVHGLARLLESCMSDEIEHKIEAESLAGVPYGLTARFVRHVVSRGSAAAVWFARLV